MRFIPSLKRSITSAILITVFVSSAAAQNVERSRDEGIWKQVLDLYEKAREAGEQVPQDVHLWAKEDIAKIGDWEYLVTTVPISDLSNVQSRLNELGSERWELIWIHLVGDKTALILKRPARSYLMNIPLSKLLKLVPRGESSGE